MSRSCPHAFEDLTSGLSGLGCRSCGQKFDARSAHTILLWALQRRFSEADARIAAAEGALLELGLQPCEKCGRWLRPGRRTTFHVKIDGGDLVLCPRCLRDCLYNEEDEVLFDPKTANYPQHVVRAATAVALALPAREPARDAILRAFPGELRRRRAS